MADKETDTLHSILINKKIIGSWWRTPAGEIHCESDATGNSWECESVDHAIEQVADDYRDHVRWKKSHQ